MHPAVVGSAGYYIRDLERIHMNAAVMNLKCDESVYFIISQKHHLAVAVYAPYLSHIAIVRIQILYPAVLLQEQIEFKMPHFSGVA
jgi:hypothetical protein